MGVGGGDGVDGSPFALSTRIIQVSGGAEPSGRGFSRGKPGAEFQHDDRNRTLKGCSRHIVAARASGLCNFAHKSHVVLFAGHCRRTA